MRSPCHHREDYDKVSSSIGFSPHASAKDTENALHEQLNFVTLACHTLQTEFKSCESLHVAVNEEDFPLINNTGYGQAAV